VPHCPAAARLPAEDVLGLKAGFASHRGGGKLIAVPITPRIANFDDLDPLRQEPDVEVVLVEKGEPIPAEAALVLLPGSKTTIDDLAYLREAGWDIDIQAHVRRCGRVLGLCGGYQMLGREIHDPHGIEGPPRSVEGLGLLDVTTVLTDEKCLDAVTGASLPDRVPLAGYEMHVGETRGPALARPFARLADGREDGAVSADGRVVGTYLHGLFGHDAQRRRWLDLIGAEASDLDYERTIEDVLDGLAEHLEQHVDIDALWRISGEAGRG
jgi:adenosylcobyric acid synthase